MFLHWFYNVCILFLCFVFLVFLEWWYNPSIVFLYCFCAVCALLVYCLCNVPILFFCCSTLSHEVVMQVSHGACASFADRLSSGRIEPGTKKACVTTTAQLVP